MSDESAGSSEYRRKIQSVPCPTCEQPAGKACTVVHGRMAGKNMGGWHAARLKAAEGYMPSNEQLLKAMGARPERKRGRRSWPRKKD